MALPSFSKIVIVLEENHGYTQIIGSSNAPYINSLVPSSALFTDSHGGPDVLHPSFPNYMQLFSGATQGVTNDNCPPAGQPYSAANMASAAIAAGKTFGGYAESAPSSRTSCSGGTGYAGRHVPYAWFSNVPSNTIHDFTAFPTSAAGYAALPDLSFVVPGVNHDMHSFGSETDAQTIQIGDAWLKQNLDAYLQWAKSNNSLFIIQFDEDNFTTGDHVPTLFCGANVKPGQYSEHITHYNILRTICDLLGATPMAGAASAVPITDVWASGGGGGSAPGPPTGLTVTGTTATSVSLSWTAPSQGPVTGYDVFRNGTKVASPTTTSATVTGLTTGTTYSFTVDAFNTNGASAQTSPVTATPGGTTQSGWGGLQFTTPATAPFTAITATFTVPALSGDTGALCSIWVGLGNVQQTGIFCAFNTGSSGNNAARPWTWYLPAGEQWSEAAYPVAAGDSLTLALSYGSQFFYTTQVNHTKGWSYTEQKSILAASQGGDAGGGAFLFPYTTAEVIIEKEGSNDLPNYGTLTFTSVSTTPAFAGTVPITTVNTSVDQTPGAFSGSSFTMTWNAFR